MSDEIPESDRVDDLPHPRERFTLYGHEAAEREFLEAFRSGKLHHAWIIGGPKGIGKATFAYRVARFVLKHRDPEAVPVATTDLHLDSDDPIARRVASLGHSDLLVLRRPWDHKTKQLKTVVTVDEVRRAANFFGRTAGEGGWRICVVDAADEMNPNAANALLKILEEPPPMSLFLLVAHAPGRLLPTIRSRCRRIVLQPPEPVAAARVMTEIIESKGGGVDANDVETAARIAQGSIGRGLQIARGGGIALQRELTALMDALPDVDVRRLHKLADTLGPRGASDSFTLFTGMLVDWLAMMVRVAATDDVGFCTAADAAIMKRLAARGNLAVWAETYEKIGHSLAQANALNLDRKQVILNMFFDLEEAAKGVRAA